jgi:hypothetical protein
MIKISSILKEEDEEEKKLRLKIFNKPKIFCIYVYFC